MFGWGHGVVWKDAPPVVPLGGRLDGVLVHATTEHNAASAK
jgi:hypothetical protein